MKAVGFDLKFLKACLNSTFSFPFLFFSVSLQVDIVPSQGEISVGESKFFLCQGKCLGSHHIPKLASKIRRSERKPGVPNLEFWPLLSSRSAV